MMAHMLLGMIAPILLVLGGPVTLALRVLPAAGRGRCPGLREAIVGALHSRPARFITHPLVVFPLFVLSFYALYFTSLFEVMIASHLGHLVMNLHFLVVGYLYYWVIIGVDPSPRQVQPMIKLAHADRRVAVPCVLRAGADELAHGDGRRLLQRPGAAVGDRPGRRAATGRRHRLGRHRDPDDHRDDRAAVAVGAQRRTGGPPVRPGRRPRRPTRSSTPTTGCSPAWPSRMPHDRQPFLGAVPPDAEEPDQQDGSV